MNDLANTNYFNTREMATIIWIVVFSAIFLYWDLKGNREIITSLKIALKSFFQKFIILTLLLELAYFSMIIWLLFKANFWEISLLKETIIWFLFVGFILTFQIHGSAKSLRIIIKNGINFTIFMEFMLNMYSFSLFWEVILQAVLFLIFANKEGKQVKKFVENIIIFIILPIAFITILKIFQDLSNIDITQTIKLFALHPILLITFIPLLYLLLLYSAYEKTLIKLTDRLADKTQKSFIKWKLMKAFHFNQKKLEEFLPYATRELGGSCNKVDVKKIINSFDKKTRQEESNRNIENENDEKAYKEASVRLMINRKSDNEHDESFLKEFEDFKNAGGMKILEGDLFRQVLEKLKENVKREHPDYSLMKWQDMITKAQLLYSPKQTNILLTGISKNIQNDFEYDYEWTATIKDAFGKVPKIEVPWIVIAIN